MPVWHIPQQREASRALLCRKGTPTCGERSSALVLIDHGDVDHGDVDNDVDDGDCDEDALVLIVIVITMTMFWLCWLLKLSLAVCGDVGRWIFVRADKQMVIVTMTLMRTTITMMMMTGKAKIDGDCANTENRDMSRRLWRKCNDEANIKLLIAVTFPCKAKIIFIIW